MKSGIKIIFLIFIISYSVSAIAQKKELGLYSPKYFGPSALPVPDIHDGRTLSDMRIEVYNDFYLGYSNDKTIVPSIKATIPLFSDRVNLTTWMGVYEIYESNPQKLAEMHLDKSTKLKGGTVGDVYISTDIQLLRQRSKWFVPDVVFRSAMKTASGDAHNEGRYFDCPAYFFDVSVAKSIFFKNSFFNELRVVGSGGFLCWQVANGTQNDAVMYGVKSILTSKYFSAMLEYGGYVGWIKNGDSPQRIKGSLYGHIKQFDVFIQYQYGLQDYPYHLFRIGVSYQFSLSKKPNKL